ncbi:UNVERIFIED_CONTAM: hypothetical protein RMT77_005554 [Armadillidium vulgare]
MGDMKKILIIFLLLASCFSALMGTFHHGSSRRQNSVSPYRYPRYHPNGIRHRYEREARPKKHKSDPEEDYADNPYLLASFF